LPEECPSSSNPGGTSLNSPEFRRAFAFALAAIAFLAARASGGETEAPRIFDSTATLAIALEGDWNAIRVDRKAPEKHAATLSYDGPEGRVAFPLEIETRGHSRLLKDTCDFPPLRLELAKGAAKGTLFRGIDELKLVTHCRTDTRFQQYVLLEYLVYRSYALLTNQSYRVRLLRIAYREPGGKEPRWERLGFLIEDAEGAAKRLGAEAIAERAIDPARVDPEAAGRAEVFYYWAGMTDFSLKAGTEKACCHNARMLRLPSGALFPIPYDFDQTGVVDPPYALPEPKLGIRRVTQRLFRGACARSEAQKRAIALLQAKRGDIEALFHGQEGLEAASQRKALGFLGGFYTWASDPALVQETLAGKCLQSSAARSPVSTGVRLPVASMATGRSPLSSSAIPVPPGKNSPSSMPVSTRSTRPFARARMRAGSCGV
jgi:hypothetical protein